MIKETETTEILLAISALDSLVSLWKQTEQKEENTLIDYDSSNRPIYIGTLKAGKDYHKNTVIIQHIAYDSSGNPRYIMTAKGKHKWIDRKYLRYWNKV